MPAPAQTGAFLVRREYFHRFTAFGTCLDIQGQCPFNIGRTWEEKVIHGIARLFAGYDEGPGVPAGCNGRYFPEGAGAEDNSAGRREFKTRDHGYIQALSEGKQLSYLMR